MQQFTIFGIDLGATNSVISYLDDDHSVQTCRNQEGSNITPSVVDLTDIAPVVGQLAKDNKFFCPHSVLDFFKREMGHGNEVIYYGEDCDKETTSIQLSSEVLKYLAKYATDETGSKVSVGVITVPAYFGTDEKKATKDAAELAGFEEAYIVKEPLAVIKYYNWLGLKLDDVLVFHLGGSTFNVTAAKRNNGKFRVFLTEGDKNLGGKDWDLRMQKIIQDKLLEKYVDPEELDDEDNVEIQYRAEKVKKALTQASSTDVHLRLSVGRKDLEVTRQEFENATKDLLDRLIEITHAVIERFKVERGKKLALLLEGGACYMPQIQKRLVSEFPDFAIIDPIEPILAASKGAALMFEDIIGEVSPPPKKKDKEEKHLHISIHGLTGDGTVYIQPIGAGIELPAVSIRNDDLYQSISEDKQIDLSIVSAQGLLKKIDSTVYATEGEPIITLEYLVPEGEKKGYRLSITDKNGTGIKINTNKE